MLFLIFQNQQLIVTENNLPISEKEVALIKTELHYRHKISKLHDQDIYCAEITPDYLLPPPLKLLPLREALNKVAPEWYTIVSKAYAVINWDKYHLFCGRCMTETQKSEEVLERICPTCKNIFYPRISPSVIVLIHKQDQILMARSPHFSKGSFGLIAGFIEPGESAEDAVHREVAEEVGIKIKNLHYYGSQAWPFPDSLMFGFIAEYASGDLVIDHRELEQAGWYHYSDLPGRPSSKVSIGSKILDHFIAIRLKREAGN
jgi:NAD+ diphosphatase